MEGPNERKLQEKRVLLHEGLGRQHVRVENIRRLQKVPEKNPVILCDRANFTTTQRNLLSTGQRNVNRFANCVRNFAEET